MHVNFGGRQCTEWQTRDNGLLRWERRNLVQNDLMVQWIVSGQKVNEHLPVGGSRLEACQGPVAGHTDLP
jgi:hypothetical protein